MRHTLLPSLLATVACATIAGAQTPTPGPELQRLAYFLGTWRAEAEMKASAFGPAGKVTNVTSSEWTLGNFFTISHHEEHNPAGTFTVMSVTGYDPKKKVYVRYSFDGQGGVERSEGTYTREASGDHPEHMMHGMGETWTWTSEFASDGQVIKTRSIDRLTSATSYDFTWAVAQHGTDWTILQQGTATKAP